MLPGRWYVCPYPGTGPYGPTGGGVFVWSVDCERILAFLAQARKTFGFRLSPTASSSTALLLVASALALPMISAAGFLPVLCAFSTPISLVKRVSPCADANCIFGHVAARMRLRPEPSVQTITPVLRIEVGDTNWIVDTRGEGNVYQTGKQEAEDGVEPDAVVAVPSFSTLLAILEERLCIPSALLQRKLRLRGDLSALSSVSWLLPSLSDDSSDQTQNSEPRLRQLWKRLLEMRLRLRPWPRATASRLLRKSAKQIRTTSDFILGAWVQALSKPAQVTVSLSLGLLALLKPLDRRHRRRCR